MAAAACGSPSLLRLAATRRTLARNGIVVAICHKRPTFAGVKETLSIKISVATKARLKAVARARDTKPSVLLREALELVLEGDRARPSLFELNRDLLDDLGSGGPADLSTNPAHLEGFGR